MSDIFIVLQEGGSSSEVYVHAHETEEEALKDMESCEEAAYQVQGPYQVPQPLADVLLSNSTVEKQFWTLLDNICKAVKEF